jgi:hypothetical protein
MEREMTSMRLMLVAGALALLGVGCGDDDRGPGRPDAGGRRDSGSVGVDSGTPDEDSGTPDEDAGMPDEDGGMPDEDGGPGCVDDDGDGYGEGAECLAPDCDDTNEDVNEGATERCNSIDDDCDGTTDDGFTDLGAACTAGDGECAAAGVRVCTGDGSGTECDAIPGTPGTESCNGLDDDCDGTADNGFAGLGDACSAGTGACMRTGTNVCAAGGASVTCDAVSGTPGTETCNSMDDDCNGMTDEGLGTSTCGMGECSRTVNNCEGGVMQMCVPGASGTEICDTRDNDCDGMVDEMLGSTSCGMGVCARTVMNCIGGVAQMCSPGMAMPETCNSLDDDCNGVADDGLGTISCGMGACARTVPACTGGVMGTCTPGTPAATDACPANGIDEDCNGTADEDCPSNDLFASATTITLGSSETVVTGSTVGALRDGPTTTCACSTGPNVWYRFVLGTNSVVYFDTAGSTLDTGLFITDAAGALVPAQAANDQANAGLCNDDSGCASGSNGWTSTLNSRTWGRFNAGTYYVSVTGCGSGAFTLRAQMVPTTLGSFFYQDRFGPGMATDSTFLIGTSEESGTCGGTGSGEDVRWIATCGAQQFFSLCTSDGGTFERREGTTNFDPTMYIRSAQSGAQVSCNDDGGTMGGVACAGTGGDASQFGSRLNNVTVPRGLNSVFVDSITGMSGMNYTLAYTVRD